MSSVVQTFPRLTLYRIACGCRCNSVLSRNIDIGLSGCTKFFHLLYLLWIQFCHAVLGSSQHDVPALFYHVVVVIFNCAEEQMSGIAALRVIAMMTDKQSIGDFPLFNAECHTVGSLEMLPKAKHPVPFSVKTSCPLPALGSRPSINIAPKLVRHFQSPLYPSLFGSQLHCTRGSSLALSGTSFSTDRAKNRGSLLDIVHNIIIGQPLAHSQYYQEN